MEKECEERLRQIGDGFQSCRTAFTAMGDETRQLLLLILLEGGLSGIRVGEIAEKAHPARPSVSHHLRILKESGIVAVRKEGTKNYYTLNGDETLWREIAGLAGLICASVRHGNPTEKAEAGGSL